MTDMAVSLSSLRIPLSISSDGNKVKSPPSLRENGAP